MEIVKLDRAEIKSAIEMGNNAYGRRWLAVSPDGGYRIHWADDNRQWDPWHKDDKVIGIPALDPEGSGKASEDAQDMLRALGLKEEAEALREAEDIGWIEAAERLAADDWAYNRAEAVDWLAEAFRAACNGDGDLNDPAPWGYDYGEDAMPETETRPPFEFEWK